MMTLVVWFLLLLGPSVTSPHQIIDNFPTSESCEAFRVNLQQMLNQGVAPRVQVSACHSRAIIVE